LYLKKFIFRKYLIDYNFTDALDGFLLSLRFKNDRIDGYVRITTKQATVHIIDKMFIEIHLSGLLFLQVPKY
jgi:hypothetical protein